MQQAHCSIGDGNARRGHGNWPARTIVSPILIITPVFNTFCRPARLSAQFSLQNRANESSDFQGRSFNRHRVDLAARSSAAQGRSSSNVQVGSSTQRSGSIGLASHNTTVETANRRNRSHHWTSETGGQGSPLSFQCAFGPQAVMAFTRECVQVFHFNGTLCRALVQSFPLRAIWCCCIHYIAKCSWITDKCDVSGQGSHSAAYIAAESVCGDQEMLAAARQSRASRKPFGWIK